MKITIEDLLLPCPFCGGKAYIESFGNRLYIECNHTKICSCFPNTWLYSDKDIYEQMRTWNRRINHYE